MASQHSVGEKEPSHPMTVAEYAKVRAVLVRITGLRMAMVATILIGFGFSIIMFLLSFGYAFLSRSTAGNLVMTGIVTLVVAIALAGYLSYRINKHISRLSKGKYEPPRVID